MHLPERDMGSAPSQTEASVLHGLAVSAFGRGDIELALRFMSRACASLNASAMCYRDYAEMLDRQGQSEAAEAAARLAIQRDPDCARAWESLGTVLFRRGSLQESCDCYTRAVEIDPTFAHALNNLAVTLDQLGRFEPAEECYRRALRVLPDTAELQLNLAMLLGHLDRHREGLEIARQVLSCRPNMFRAHFVVRELETILRDPRSTPSPVKRSAKNSKQDGTAGH